MGFDINKIMGKIIPTFLRHHLIWLLTASALALAALRIWLTVGLSHVFFIDEASRAGVVKALLTDAIPENVDRFGFLFIETDADCSAFTFLMPATLWSFFFGYSMPSLRIFVCLVTILAIILLGRAISYWFGQSPKVWLFALIIGLMMPWNFLQGMLFWDSTLAPLYLIISFWSFSFLVNVETEDKRKTTILAHILLPLGLVFAATSYRSTAFVAVACWLIFYSVLFFKKILSAKTLSFHILYSCVLALPFTTAILLWPTMTNRASHIAVTTIEGFVPRVRAVLSNYRGLLSFDFLFWRGDHNLRHAIGVSGMVGLSAVIPLISVPVYAARKMLSKKEGFLALFSLTGIIMSFAGAALTIEGNPHSLRSGSAWLFFVILLSVGITKLYQERHNPGAAFVLGMAAIVAVLCFTYYVYYFHGTYLPEQAHAWFSYDPISDGERFPFVGVYDAQ